MHTAAELRQKGYHPGAPSRQAEQDDKPIAQRPCPQCGTTMSYRPWSRIAPYSYLAIAACDKCGHEEEF